MKASEKIIYLLVCILFMKMGFKKILSKHSLSELEEWMNKSIKKENYELAAYLKYYIEFKHKKKFKALTL